MAGENITLTQAKVVIAFLAFLAVASLGVGTIMGGKLDKINTVIATKASSAELERVEAQSMERDSEIIYHSCERGKENKKEYEYLRKKVDDIYTLVLKLAAKHK